MLQHFASQDVGHPHDFEPWLIAMEPEEFQYAETKLTQDRDLWGYVKDKV